MISTWQLESQVGHGPELDEVESMSTNWYQGLAYFRARDLIIVYLNVPKDRTIIMQKIVMGAICS